MPEHSSASCKQNRILAALSNEDFGLLQPSLEPVELQLRQRLESPNRQIGHVYFVEQGFASVVANSFGDRNIEVGLIGREGMTGLAIVMGTDRSPNETMVQGKGKGVRIAADELRQALARSAAMHTLFLRYAHVFGVQASQTALVNGRAKLEERLARWLLMAHDRIDGDEVALSHEFLAIMLGVRRAGVTVALNQLAKDGVIATQRGSISIIDRKGLEEAAHGSYGTPEAEFRRLFD